MESYKTAQSEDTSWIFALLCLLAAIERAPQLLTFPFCQWSIAGSLVLVYAALERCDVRTELLNIAAWLSAVTFVSPLVLFFLVSLTPRTIDASLDLGIDWIFYRWALLHHGWNTFFWFIYKMLPFAAAVSIGCSQQPKRAAWAMAFAGLIAVPLYVAFPAVGPGALGQRSAPRNCMPSLHLTWAILLAYFSNKRMRAVLIIFALLTAVSTLTTGQHYVVDLVAALPLVAFCIWLTEASQATKTENSETLEKGTATNPKTEANPSFTRLF